MILVIVLSSISIDLIYEKKINYKLLFTSVVALFPLLFWKYIFIKNNIKMEFLQYGDPLNRFLDRITNTEDLYNIMHYLIMNEKLIISLALFTFIAFKYINRSKKLIFFISLNLLLYFCILIGAILITPHTVLIQLEQSSVRIFIPLVLTLIYFSVYLIKDDYYFRIRKILN